jgi:hypothetical protein
VATWKIVPERSRVTIDARSSVHPIHASTEGLEGHVELEFAPDGRLDLSATPAGKVSLRAERLSSGNRLEDREMLKRIDTRRFPVIEGVLRSVGPAGEDGSYVVRGDVSFHGVSREKEGKMVIRALDERAVSLQGSARFDIREWGMEPPRVLMLRVEPEVDVAVDIVARKEE